MNKKIIISTNNKHKILEIKSIIGMDPEIEILSPESLNIELEDVEETGSTYQENAILKLSGVKELKDPSIYILADDSGLEVEALDGRPGLFSSRYAGKKASNSEKIEKILREVANKDNKNAKFVSVIAVKCPDGEIYTFRGEIAGTLIKESKGIEGFGYDPIFLPHGYTQTFGELSSKIKDSISHRAISIKKAVNFIKKL